MLDARKTAELTRLIGEAELRRLRDRLMGQLATAFARQADLAPGARGHVIVAMAGSLGFEDLAAACPRARTAITAGNGLPDAVTEARRAVAWPAAIARPPEFTGEGDFCRESFTKRLTGENPGPIRPPIGAGRSADRSLSHLRDSPGRRA